MYRRWEREAPDGAVADMVGGLFLAGGIERKGHRHSHRALRHLWVGCTTSKRMVEGENIFMWEKVRTDFVEDPQLYRAIGRVSAESALFDELVREVIGEVIDGSDYLWILFEGQPTEWLIDTALKIMKEIDPYHEIWRDDLYSRFNSIMGGAGKIRPIRNAVVHGIWTRATVVDGDMITPKPWPTIIIDDENPYYCSRSRKGKIFEVRNCQLAMWIILPIDSRMPAWH
jgi:hypothetical protein